MDTGDLVGPASWPNTSVEFIFEKPQGGARRGLTLRIAFDASTYAAQRQERALEDAATYDAVAKQFLEPDARVAVESSMDANTPHSLEPEVFATFAQSVAAYLRELVKGAAPAPPAPLSIHAAVEPENADDLFALAVTLTILNAQGRAASNIPARANTEFANALETAYAGTESYLKVLVECRNSEKPEPECLWLMRLRRVGASAGAGIAFATNGPARYYAPLPLSHVPLSRSHVPIVRFDPANGIDWNDPVDTAFSEVDMDAWARYALAAIERFLSLESGGAQSENARKLTQIKAELAGRIAATVSPILADSEPPQKNALQNAIKTMRQQIMLNAESAYDIAAICQFEATVRSRYDDDPPNGVYAPRFAGTIRAETPNVSGASQASFQFTPVRTALAPGKAFVTSALTLAEPEVRTELPLSLSFAIESVEYAGARSRFSFLLPFDSATGMAPQTAIGAVDVPIVLRSIPEPPALASQEARPSENPARELAAVERWTYAFSYEKRTVPHDTIDVSLSFNIAEARAVTPEPVPSGARDLDLFDHLARIVSVIPAMLQAPARAPDDFVRLVEPLPEAWAAWRPIENSQLIKAAISLRERNEDGLLVLTRTIDASAGSLPDPVIQIMAPTATYTAQPTAKPNEFYYVDERGNRLTYETAQHLSHRQIVLRGLHVAALQNAACTVQITRNRASRQFVYSSTPVRFAGNATPQLSSGERFDVSLLSSPPQQTLATHLQALLATLFNGTTPEMIQAVRLDGAYARRIADELPEVEVPIFTAPDMALDERRAAGFAAESAAHVLTWFAANPQPDGYFRFKLLLFPTLNRSRSPLLELTDLELRRSDVTDLPAVSKPL